MRKSIFLRRTVLLLAVALIISSLLSASIYYVITQRLFVRIHAENLMPMAQGIAQMVAAKIENPEEPVDPAPLLNPGRGDFLGAQLHIYGTNGEVMDYSSQKKGPGGEYRLWHEARCQQPRQPQCQRFKHARRQQSGR